MATRRCRHSTWSSTRQRSCPLAAVIFTLSCSAPKPEPTVSVGGKSTNTSGAAGSRSSSGGVGVVLGRGGAVAFGGSPTGGATASALGGGAPTRAAGGAQGGLNSTGGSANPTGGYAGRPSATGGASSTGGAFTASDCEAFWDFETLVDGKVPDVSGHGLALTLTQSSVVAGPRGNHLSLSGTNTSAIAAAPVIDTLASFSISVWVRLDKLDSYNTIVSQDGQNISSFYLQKRNSGRLALTTFPVDDVGATGCVTEGAIQPRAGEWYHLVATRNAATREQRLYVDGVLSGKTSCAGGFASTAPLVVGRGRWQGPADWMSGAVDELCVRNRVITAEQAVDLYQQGRPAGKNFLFAYFAEQALGRGDGLRLAQSHDALYWGAIGGGKVFLPPTVGGKSFRDPHVMRDPKAVYHLVWTTSCVPWAESGCVQDKGFGHAQSTDLVHWSEPSYVPIALNVEHVWAPETIYDAASGQYLVYWSSPIDNTPSAADPHSIYYVLTKDFVSFSDPAVLYSRNGRNFIDANIIQQSSGYLMFLKDEADGQKNIRALTSNTLYGAGAWTAEPSNSLTGSYAAEGPAALLGEGQLFLFFDKFAEGTYGALRSNGLANLAAPATWTDISSSVFFAGVRHGTPIEVPWEVYRAVALKAGE